MPSKNTLKQYIQDGYYHIYNRGVEKRPIFLEEKDCIVFLRYMKLYLSPVEDLLKIDLPGVRIQKFIYNNLAQEVTLLAFSLMPNHIHLQLKQHTERGIIKFMRRLLTSYVMYFNNKYKRVGSLFQNRYKAALIQNDPYLLHLSRYIHLNPMRINAEIDFLKFSSYSYYLGEKHASWIQPQEILEYFSGFEQQELKEKFSYKQFVEEYQVDSSEILGSLTLEKE